MTFYIRIQFPDGIVAWELGAKDQATALHAAFRALAVRIHGADAIRQDVLDIADELEAQVDG
jgi:hypothetical protein